MVAFHWLDGCSALAKPESSRQALGQSAEQKRVDPVGQADRRRREHALAAIFPGFRGREAPSTVLGWILEAQENPLTLWFLSGFSHDTPKLVTYCIRAIPNFPGRCMYTCIPVMQAHARTHARQLVNDKMKCMHRGYCLSVCSA